MRATYILIAIAVVGMLVGSVPLLGQVSQQTVFVANSACDTLPCNSNMIGAFYQNDNCTCNFTSTNVVMICLTGSNSWCRCPAGLNASTCTGKCTQAPNGPDCNQNFITCDTTVTKPG